MATANEMDEILRRLANSYPDWKPPSMAATFQEYKLSLAKFPAELLRRAVDRCKDSCLFFPKIMEIKRACAEIVATDSPIYDKKDFEKQVISPETSALIAAFRAKMVEQGKWKEGRKHHG
jgi:hypothetical protein